MDQMWTLQDETVNHPGPARLEPTPLEFPIEILSMILGDCRPVYQKGQAFDVGDHAYSYWQKNYFANLSESASHRLVSRTWYNFITPYLYSTVVVKFGGDGFKSNAHLAVDHHPELIETLVLRGYHFGRYDRPALTQVRKRVLDYLVRCFSSCSSLRWLELLDFDYYIDILSPANVDQAFSSMSTPLSNLLISVSEDWSNSSMKSLWAVLRAVESAGIPVEQLEIKGVTQREALDTIPDIYPWPKGLHSLQGLVLRCLPAELIERLLGLIYVQRRTTSRTTQLQSVLPPHHLSISTIADEGWEISSFPRMLDTAGVGACITSLRLHTTWIYAEEDLEHLPVAICKACPLLTRFLHFIPCTPTWLLHVPATLEVLGIFVANDPMPRMVHTRRLIIQTAQPFIDFVLGGTRRHHLKKVCVGWEKVLVGNRSDAVTLQQACNAVEVEFEEWSRD